MLILCPMGPADAGWWGQAGLSVKPGTFSIRKRCSVMPKMKTNKATAKRVRLTAKGKIKISRPMRSHLKSRKTPKRLRGLRKSRLLDPKFVKSAMHLLGLA